MHLLMLLVTVCWASNIIAGKDALTGFGPMALADLRILGTAVTYIICFLAAGKARGLNLMPRLRAVDGRRDGGSAIRQPTDGAQARKGLLMVVVAAGGIALNQLMFIGGLARSTVAHSGLIVALGPVIVLVIAVVLRLEVLTAWKFVGMMIAFAGVGILTVDKAGQGNTGHWVGDLILLGSTFVFAIYTVLMKEVAYLYDALTLNTLIFAMGSIMMAPFCIHAVATTHWTSVTLEAWWGLTFLVVFGSVISYLLFAYVLTELSASRAAAFSYLQPAISTALGIWVLSERLTPNVLAGGALILAGVYLTERERGEERAPESHAAD
jgi:drug/metabolite transporter (DMT)-like permease